jgi:hypothetical protein
MLFQIYKDVYSAFNMNYILKSPAVKKDRKIKIVTPEVFTPEEKTGFFVLFVIYSDFTNLSFVKVSFNKIIIIMVNC